MPYPQGLRLQSECDSSAFDEGASSTLIRSISNEEQNMQDLLEDDNDDIFYNVMDTQQHDADMADSRHSAQQLNTMELHGLLGQHGYKLPELAGDQEEEEESEGEGEDGAGDCEEDLDDPDVDDDEEEEDDEDSSKAIFKVYLTVLSRVASKAEPKFMRHITSCVFLLVDVIWSCWHCNGADCMC